MILLDTSGLLAALVPGQRAHGEASRILQENEGPFAMSPFVLAELDYLITKFKGQKASLDLLDEVARGAYRLTEFSPGNVAQAQKVIEAHADLGIGLADASIVVLAQTLGTCDVLTLDERHFRALRAANDQPFRILPADA